MTPEEVDAGLTDIYKRATGGADASDDYNAWGDLLYEQSRNAGDSTAGVS